MQSTTFYAMGSRIHITVDSEAPEIQERLRLARAWFQAWERSFSRFLPESELSQLNRQAGQAVRVSADLWTVLRAALQAAHKTGGLVNPTLLSALEAAGYDRSFEKLPAKKEDPAVESIPLDPDAWKLIEMDAKTKTVCLPQEVRIDLGGIAKGWVADRAARRLGKAAPVVVDAGGDIAVSGPRADGQPWQIAIGHPLHPDQHLCVLHVLSGGVATSGRNYRHWLQGGKQQHHLIDPRTGQPAVTDVLAASVVAASTLEAETAAKAVLILGSRLGLAWLDSHPRLAGLAALEDGQVLYSRRFSSYIR